MYFYREYSHETMYIHTFIWGNEKRNIYILFSLKRYVAYFDVVWNFFIHSTVSDTLFLVCIYFFLNSHPFLCFIILRYRSCCCCCTPVVIKINHHRRRLTVYCSLIAFAVGLLTSSCCCTLLALSAYFSFPSICLLFMWLNAANLKFCWLTVTLIC